MSVVRRLGLAALVLACGPWGSSQAGVYVGVRVGGPYCYRPYYGYRPFIGVGFYGPAYPVYVAPPPVVVAPAPVVVQQAPVVAQPAYTAPSPPAPLPPPTPAAAAPAAPAPLTPAVATSAVPNRQADIDACIGQLNSQQEEARVDALIQLGRLKARRATGPIIRALNGDPSPKVRETAARSLGLIGAPDTLAALQRAAQADEDRDVRHSAGFSAEIIRGAMQQRNP
jgi:HEAT repeats